MRLSQLLLDMDYTVLQGEQDREISTLVYDSRKVEQDSVFVCISGAVRDGHDFVTGSCRKRRCGVDRGKGSYRSR